MTATQAAMIMMSGSADLEDITINENGEYKSVDHDGFKTVTVEVPTMVECAEEVAEILGVDTSQEWDCDDIKAKAQEVVDENEELKDELEEMQECCDKVVDVIHDYDPTYDPHPDPPDPTNPTIPEKIQEIIDEESGYEFPPDVTLPEISELIAGESTVSTPTSEWEIEVFLYAESYDGSVTKRVRTLHTGGESWFFRPAISFIHGDEEHVVMPTNYRYQIGPSASEWVSITGWSIDSSTTVSLSWINQDSYTRSWSGSYAGADLTPLMTGPYIVKNK